MYELLNTLNLCTVSVRTKIFSKKVIRQEGQVVKVIKLLTSAWVFCNHNLMNNPNMR